MQLSTRKMVAFATLGTLFGTVGSAQAAFLPDGEYYLENHVETLEAPPEYGLRLDELYNVTFDHDIFTFDFDDARSDMRIDVSGTTIRIFGTVWGGRDVGGAYAADAYQGLYTIDFLYNVGVSTVPGDDDRWVTGADYANAGTITTPLSDVFLLGDKNSMDAVPYSFRLGDEDSDLGHRGETGISGWGWVSHGLQQPFTHIGYSDWLFVVGDRVPAPGSAALVGLAGLVAMRRKRN